MKGIDVFGHRDLMITLALQHGWKNGAMLGIGSGSLLCRFLSEVPYLRMIGVDHFVRSDRKHRVMSIAGDYSDRCVIYACRTSQAAKMVEDESLDFIFVDAGHKYGCVRSDLRAWWGKVRTGGWFGGHAYEESHPGVVMAVDERFGDSVLKHGYSVWSVEKS